MSSWNTLHVFFRHVCVEHSSRLLSSCLRGTLYTSSLVSTDPSYLNKAEHADVKFIVEGQAVFAHKAVLMHTSSRFNKILNSLADDNSQTPVVQLNDIRYKTLQVRASYIAHQSPILFSPTM